VCYVAALQQVREHLHTLLIGLYINMEGFIVIYVCIWRFYLLYMNMEVLIVIYVYICVCGCVNCYICIWFLLLLYVYIFGGFWCWYYLIVQRAAREGQVREGVAAQPLYYCPHLCIYYGMWRVLLLHVYI
jgi:hypothetical protein